ncbi:MAG TPA: hemolysin family protein [Anaerovoracaceae bacterium]|nr:hemolysin family protein [Anaerovoracaceae bacterium]
MSSDPSSLLIYITLVIFLTVIYGITVAVKRALDTTNKSLIDEMIDEGDDAAKKVESLLEKPSKYHYANKVIAVTVNIINISTIFYLMFPLNDIIKEIGILVLYMILFMVLGEFLPKKFAAQDSIKYSIKYSGFQIFIIKLTWPIVYIALGLTNILLKIMRKNTNVDDNVFSEDRVMSMLDKGQLSGEIKEEGKNMINSIFAFDDMLAHEIMTPRTDVFMIDISDPVEEYLEELMELRYSRIPVYENDTDNIIGIFHIKDYLIKARDNGFENVDIREILRKAYFVPETKNIDSLLLELQRQKQHIAILIDEYGGVSGIVTIEDIIEQIMGDIDDEYDEDDHVIETIDDNTYLIDGIVDLDDINRELNVKLESESSETIGGFIIDMLGEIPDDGVNYVPMYYDNYEFNIVSVKDRRIEKVKLIIDNKEE